MTDRERINKEIEETRRLLKNLWEAAEALRDNGKGQLVICKDENITVNDIACELYFMTEKW